MPLRVGRSRCIIGQAGSCLSVVNAVHSGDFGVAREIMRVRNLFLALALAAVSFSVAAAPLEGTDYRKIDPPQRPSTPNKIEVLEFFSYGCPHCNEFYPLVSGWAAKLPKDVVLKRVATGLGRKPWTNLAKMYYALESTGDLTRLDGQIFHAIHEEHLPLFDEKAISDWVTKHGVDPAKFNTAFESFGVNTKANQAEDMVESYKIEGVPTLTVDGKYVVLGNSFEEILTNADAVIAMDRAERAAAAAAAAQK
jgi:thiol:disulfide interchange protein DsbA